MSQKDNWINALSDVIVALLITVILGWDISLFAKLTLMTWLNFFAIPLFWWLKLNLPIWATYIIILCWVADFLQAYDEIKERREKRKQERLQFEKALREIEEYVKRKKEVEEVEDEAV